MGKKMSFWLNLVIQLVIALAIAALLYFVFVDDLNTAIYEHRRYITVPEAWPVYCASNALFVPGVMWLGVSGLMWIATTGFFDIFSYAFKSLLVLFSTLKKPGEFEHFYEYKLAQDEKRAAKSVPYAMLIVGVVLVLGAAVCNIVYDNMMEPYMSSPEYQQTRQEAVEAAQEAAEADSDAAEPTDDASPVQSGAPSDAADDLPGDDETTNDTTGGENNE